MATKSRHGRTSDYKVTIKHLDRLIDLKTFRRRFVNIKFFQGDEENLKDIIYYFENNNFTINVVKDELNMSEHDRHQNRNKFISGITKDIGEFFIRNENELSKYVFILEDDSPILIKNGNLKDYINQSFVELEKDKDLEGIHFLRLSHGEIPRTVDEWYRLHEIEKIPDSEPILKKYWYNFQPRVARKEDLIKVYNIIVNNWQLYKDMHPEIAYADAFKKYNKETKSYAFSPINAYSIHLGAEPIYHLLTLQSEPDILYTYFRI
jgi:hypothetical protein